MDEPPRSSLTSSPKRFPSVQPEALIHDVPLLAKLLGKSIEETQTYINNKPKTFTPSKDVQDLQKTKSSLNRYLVEPTHVRNVLIVGRSRSGKSTVIGVLKDPCYTPTGTNLFSDPAPPKCQSFSLDNQEQKTKYTINIIDTPGLKEIRPSGEDVRTDNTILKTINACLGSEITKIHALVMVASFDTGISKDDVDSFKSYIDKFWNEKITAIICITRAEEKTEKWRNEIEAQLKEDPYFSEVLKKKNVKCCFMGCVENMEDTILKDLTDLEAKYRLVLELRRQFLYLIFGSDESVRLLDLPVTVERRNLVSDLFSNLFDQLVVLNGLSDFKKPENQQKIDLFHETLGSLLEWESLLYEPGLNLLFQTLKTRLCVLIKAKYFSPEQVRTLRHTLVLEA